MNNPSIAELNERPARRDATQVAQFHIQRFRIEVIQERFALRRWRARLQEQRWKVL